MSNGRGRFSLDSVEEDEIQIPAGGLISRPSVVPTPISVAVPSAPAPQPVVAEPEGKGSAQETLPVAPVAPAPVDAPRPVRRTSKAESTIDPLLELAAREFPVDEVRVKTSMSLPKALNDRLDDEVHRMKKLGHKKITRESIHTAALTKFFDEIDRKS